MSGPTRSVGSHEEGLMIRRSSMSAVHKSGVLATAVVDRKAAPNAVERKVNFMIVFVWLQTMIRDDFNLFSIALWFYVCMPQGKYKENTRKMHYLVQVCKENTRKMHYLVQVYLPEDSVLLSSVQRCIVIYNTTDNLKSNEFFFLTTIFILLFIIILLIILKLSINAKVYHHDDKN